MTPSSFARDPDLCVITCAVTGVLANRKQCPGIPYTPVEIAEEAKRAYDAGAAVVHIHARNDDGSPTFDPEGVREDQGRGDQKRCPIILNFSTGTILDDVTEQCTYISESRPADRRPQHGHDELLEVLREPEGVRLRHGLPEHLREDHQAARGDERGGREARARVLRHRAHARHLAAARHGRAEEAAPVLVHRERARRHPAARREPPAPDEDHAARAASGRSSASRSAAGA